MCFPTCYFVLFSCGLITILCHFWVAVSFLCVYLFIYLFIFGLIFLLSKGLSRGFSSSTLQKHQFFSTLLPLWTNSHIHTRLLEKTNLTIWIFVGNLCLCFLTLCLGLSTKVGIKTLIFDKQRL